MNIPADGDHNVDGLKEKLRGLLRDTIPPDVVEREILGFLEQKCSRRLTRNELARRLSRFVVTKWDLGSRRDALWCELIESHPQELNRVVDAAFTTLIGRFGAYLAANKPKPIRRPRALTADEKRENARRAKARYERLRTTRKVGTGLIEREFSKAPEVVNPNNGVPLRYGLVNLLFGQLETDGPPGGPCLDDIMNGGEVQMRKGMYSLEQLFGRSRKLLPVKLPHRRRGRQILYGWRAVLRCMDFLLSEQKGRHKWLPDSVSRAYILKAILERAKLKAKPEITSEIEALVSKYSS